MHEPSIATPAPERPMTAEPTSTAHPTGDSAEADAILADDPRVLQILSTEHWSLLTARSLAYNEAFTRASMFLTFLSMSFVAMALLTQAMGFTHDFFVVAAIVLGFDTVIGILTLVRIAGTGLDDLRATHGMNRIRHGYVRIAPQVAPFFVSGTHDDVPGVLKTYGYSGPGSFLGDLAYGLSTSQGMVSLIVALVGGVFAAVLT
ncbi:MAG: hypothetical protein M3R49_06570, partial [Chloroflexota bacterium]|nr:hypothetical protein [Chloroflexota bacterium]